MYICTRLQFGMLRKTFLEDLYHAKTGSPTCEPVQKIAILLKDGIQGIRSTSYCFLQLLVDHEPHDHQGN